MVIVINIREYDYDDDGDDEIDDEYEDDDYDDDVPSQLRDECSGGLPYLTPVAGFVII